MSEKWVPAVPNVWLSKAMVAENAKQPIEPGPLAEIGSWRYEILEWNNTPSEGNHQVALRIK